MWCEIPRGPAILRGVDLTIAPGERVALMGRNGAGKSTLLRHAAGLVAPTRGRVERSGRVALLLQNPNDYFLHERVRDELSAEALQRAGLDALAERNPRDLSGGERQRLALAIVADGGETPVVVALDEPTRGMDREAKAQLADELHRRAGQGQAVIVATHDPEFAASCAQRAILLADGRVIADGPAADLLAGGWYFATETARILGGAGGRSAPRGRRRAVAWSTDRGSRFAVRWTRSSSSGGCARDVRSPTRNEQTIPRNTRTLDPRRGRGTHMSWPLASFAIVAGILLAGWLAYERSRPSARMVAVVATLAAVAALGRDAFVALPDVKPITAIALVVGYALGPLPGFTVGAIGMLASNMMLGQGPYTPWQMAAWGLVGLAGALLGRVSARRMGRFGLALACAVMALVAKEIMNVYTWTLGAAHTPAAFLLIAGQGLPFDITDTVASFLFGFAFGPELARLLGRMHARMTVEWEPAHPAGTTPPALLVLVCVVGVVGVCNNGCSPRARGGPFRFGHRRPDCPSPHRPHPFRPAPRHRGTSEPVPRHPERSRARLPTSRALRTRTAALAAHRGNTAASCTRLGSRSAWPRPGVTR